MRGRHGDDVSLLDWSSPVTVYNQLSLKLKPWKSPWTDYLVMLEFIWSPSWFTVVDERVVFGRVFVFSFSVFGPFQMKGCIRVLKEQPPSSVEGLLNALRSVKHLHDPETCRGRRFQLPVCPAGTRPNIWTMRLPPSRSKACCSRTERKPATVFWSRFQKNYWTNLQLTFSLCLFVFKCDVFF